MKKLISLILATVLCFPFTTVGYAADEITVIVNGVKVEFDVQPQIINDRTMVPVRKTFEALGAKIDWSEEMSLAVATYKTTIISIQIGASSFSVTDVLRGETKTVELDVTAQIVSGRTLIPLRAISEALGKTVGWDGATRTAYINE